MAGKVLSFVIVLTMIVVNMHAGAIEDFNAKASEKVKTLVQKHNLQVVGYEHVKVAVGNGTRKTAKAVLVDARPSKKYQMGHIPSALSLPDTQFDALYEQMFKDVPKSKEIIVYCGGYTCAKSPKLASMLMKKGHTNVNVYAAGMPQWSKNNYVEIDVNIAKALHDKRLTLFIDSRPYTKFVQGTIIGSLSVPDTKFEEYKGFMPADTKTTVVTYCGGYSCGKSHNVANNLVAMGYTNVNVLASGYPSWKDAAYPTTTTGVTKKKIIEVASDVKTFLKKGEDTGTVDGEWFIKNYKTFPKTVTLVNVMSPEEFKAGHISGSININAETIKPKELLDALPKTGEVVFYCGTGVRATEAWAMLAEELEYKDIYRIFYLDANIECNKNNACSIEPNEPLGI
jgi:rhodanese-related sulfurtransferase